MAPRITAADAEPGVYFLREEDGSLWRCVGYADRPTATLERVSAEVAEFETLDIGGLDVPLVPMRMFRSHPQPHPQRIGGVVGAPIFDGFVRLVPERE